MNKAPTSDWLPAAGFEHYDDLLLDLYDSMRYPERMHDFLCGFAELLQAQAVALLTPGWSQEAGGVRSMLSCEQVAYQSPQRHQLECDALWGETVNALYGEETWCTEELGMPVERIFYRNSCQAHLKSLDIAYAVGIQKGILELSACFQLCAFRTKELQPFGWSEKKLVKGLARHVQHVLLQIGRYRRSGAHMSHFGLTPAEQRLVSQLLGGKTLRQAAEILGVKYSTVRSQLNSIFQKVGVRRQADLITRLR